MRTTLHALQKNKTQKWPTAVVNDQNCTFLIFCENVTRNDLGMKKYQQLSCPDAYSFRAELAAHCLVSWYVENCASNRT
jgi:hypothetical protein